MCFRPQWPWRRRPCVCESGHEEAFLIQHLGRPKPPFSKGWGTYLATTQKEIIKHSLHICRPCVQRFFGKGMLKSARDRKTLLLELYCIACEGKGFVQANFYLTSCTSGWKHQEFISVSPNKIIVFQLTARNSSQMSHSCPLQVCPAASVPLRDTTQAVVAILAWILYALSVSSSGSKSSSGCLRF